MAGLIRYVSTRVGVAPSRFVPQQFSGECPLTSRSLFGLPSAQEASVSSPSCTLHSSAPASRLSLQGGVSGFKVRNVYSFPPLLSTTVLPASSRLTTW